MYQIDNSTAAAAQPASTPAGSAGFFTDGNPAGGVAATVVPAEWLNAVMMELMNVLAAGGVAPLKNTFNQVVTAIRAIGKAPTVLADTGAANAYTAANAPALLVGTWVDNVVQRVKITNANTGASTYAPDGLTAIPIYGLGLQPLQGGELRAGGVATMMRSTIAGVNSGNPICVLLDCFGGAQQVAAATQSNHAVNLGMFTGSNQSFGVSGYQKLPGGLILQWGYVTGFSGYIITLPTAFPTGPLGQPIASCLGQTTAAPGAAAFAETSPVVSNQFNIYTYIPASGGGSTNTARAVAWACLGR